MSSQLSEDIMAKNPFKLFDVWQGQVESQFEANICTLATASKEGVPSCRIVAIYGHSNDGFLIFTDKRSQKGSQMIENPKAELLFFWPNYYRQVRVHGNVNSVPSQVAEEFWSKRPFPVLPFMAAIQSSPVPSKQYLLDKIAELKSISDVTPIKKPDTWGGFCVSPTKFDFSFWKPGELADRIRFRLKESQEVLGEMEHQAEDGWIFERLTP